MASRLQPAARDEVLEARARLVAAAEAGEKPAKADLKLLTKHYLALLETLAPGKSVEVRVPPFAAIQCVEGVRHTRGTPPAVIETDALTWIGLATGEIAWGEVADSPRLRASGERTDLSVYLPL